MYEYSILYCTKCALYLFTVSKLISCVCAALVAMGNCAFALGQLERARDHYRDAVDKDPSCTQALYNLGTYLCTVQYIQIL